MIFTLCQMARGRNRRNLDSLVDLGRACKPETAENFMNGRTEVMVADVHVCNADNKELIISADNFQASLAHLNQATTYLKATVRFSKHAFLTPLDKGSIIKDECTGALFIVVKIRHENAFSCSLSYRPFLNDSSHSSDDSPDDSVDDEGNAFLNAYSSANSSDDSLDDSVDEGNESIFPIVELPAIQWTIVSFNPNVDTANVPITYFDQEVPPPRNLPNWNRRLENDHHFIDPKSITLPCDQNGHKYDPNDYLFDTGPCTRMGQLLQFGSKSDSGFLCSVIDDHLRATLKEPKKFQERLLT